MLLPKKHLNGQSIITDNHHLFTLIFAKFIEVVPLYNNYNYITY